ncbi:MAG: hypothetical protein SXA11_01710 [Cyanobacteriota bacterium]|nr:hypothetical protein [Cyanobacteriota bacterium]
MFVSDNRRDACSTGETGETPVLRGKQARRLFYGGNRRDACSTPQLANRVGPNI